MCPNPCLAGQGGYAQGGYGAQAYDSQAYAAAGYGGAYAQEDGSGYAAPGGEYGYAAQGGEGSQTGSGTGEYKVKMRGLPFRASTYEVEQFFNGYQITPGSVQLGQDASGRSSGEGWISFGSAAEAQRAVQEKNRASMGSRYVELFL